MVFGVWSQESVDWWVVEPSGEFYQCVFHGFWMTTLYCTRSSCWFEELNTMQTIRNCLFVYPCCLPRRHHICILRSEWKGDLLIHPFKGRALACIGECFYTLLALPIAVLVFGVFVLAIATPKAFKYKFIPSPCALPLQNMYVAQGVLCRRSFSPERSYSSCRCKYQVLTT